MPSNSNTMPDTLPACMMPDGAEPCSAYTDQLNFQRKQAERISALEKQVSALENYKEKCQALAKGLEFKDGSFVIGNGDYLMAVMTEISLLVSNED